MSKLKKSLIFIITAVLLILISVLFFALAVKNTLPLPAIFIWFLITLPSLAATIVHFISAFIQNSNELKKLKAQRQLEGSLS